MLKVTDKYLFIGLVTVAMALIFSPFAAMHVFTTFAWWQILVAYLIFTVPALIGLSILFGVWGTFEMKREATTKH